MNKLAIIAVAGLAGVATAGPISAGSGGGTARVVNIADFADISFNHNSTRGTGNTIVTITFNQDIESVDLLSDPDNVVFALDLGGGQQATMHGIGWDVTIQSFGASWRSEATVYMDDNVAPDLTGLFLTPGVADGSPGTGTYSSGGILDLSDNGIPDIVLPNGEMRFEFFESFDDVANAADGAWLEGSVLTLDMTIVPAPGALALLGLGGLATARRRR
jgi:hypothetical protein